MSILSNNPPVTVELSREDAEWLKNSTDQNRAMLLSLLNGASSKSSAEKMVDALERLKTISNAIQKGLDPL